MVFSDQLHGSDCLLTIFGQLEHLVVGRSVHRAPVSRRQWGLDTTPDEPLAQLIHQRQGGFGGDVSSRLLQQGKKVSPAAVVLKSILRASPISHQLFQHCVNSAEIFNGVLFVALKIARLIGVVFHLRGTNLPINDRGNPASKGSSTSWTAV